VLCCPPGPGQLRLFHGTDSASAYSILLGIDREELSPECDFGAVFYATSMLECALYYSSEKMEVRPFDGAVLVYDVDKAAVDALPSVEGAEKWVGLVQQCRRARLDLFESEEPDLYQDWKTAAVVSGPICKHPNNVDVGRAFLQPPVAAGDPWIQLAFRDVAAIDVTRPHNLVSRVRLIRIRRQE